MATSPAPQALFTRSGVVSWLVPGAVAAAAVVVSLQSGAIWVGVALAVAALVLWPAVTSDLATNRIPNRTIGAAAVVVVMQGFAASAGGEMSAATAASGALWGVALSGALGLFAIWLLAPTLIGGGDVKMLAVQGAALGIIDPRAALSVGALAVGAQLGASALTRQRRLPFAPALYAGLAAGMLSTLWWHGNLEAS